MFKLSEDEGNKIVTGVKTLVRIWIDLTGGKPSFGGKK